MKTAGFLLFPLGFDRIWEILEFLSWGVGWNTKASIESGGAWGYNVVWLSYIWTQLNEGGMHQSRKNECATLGQGLNLSLSYFGECLLLFAFRGFFLEITSQNAM